MKDKKCTHVKDDGKRCRAYAQRDSLFCFSHDPGKSEQRVLAVKSGGIVTSQRPVRIIRVQVCLTGC